MVSVSIDKKNIGDNNPPYFIAEAGLNHNGNMDIAKQLINAAKDCGASAIKFQTFRTEEFLSKSSQYFDLFKDVELTYEQFGELFDYAKKIDITFFSSPFDIPSADALHNIKIPCFKIASSDLTNTPLIEHISKFNDPMIISTGLSTMDEVLNAIDVCKQNKNLIILHCIANYPTKPEEANLNAIVTMKEKLPFPIGYSDNGDSTLVDLVAVTLGASVIEKHFTLDRKSKGPDHFFSIEPDNLKKLIYNINKISEIKGNGNKSPQESEIENVESIRKSITAKSNLFENQVLTPNDLSIKRPASGIQPKFYKQILGKKTNKSIHEDTPINWEDLI